MLNRRTTFVSLTVFFAFPALITSAQQISPLQPSDTSSIKATLTSFISACNELNDLLVRNEDSSSTEIFMPAVDRILDCLDLSGLPVDLRDQSGIDAGVYLKEVIDRIEIPNMDDVPSTFDSSTEGSVAKWRIPGTRIAIARVQSGSNEGDFLFTVDTVRRADKFFSAAKNLPYRTTSGPKVSPQFFSHYIAFTRRQPMLAATTSSPRGTLALFLNTANEVYDVIRSEEFVDRNDPKYLPYTMRLTGCLDLSELPEYARDYYASEAVICLKEVLDRSELPPLEEIPGVEDLESGEGKEPLGRWQIPNTQLTIARVNEGPNRGEYLFTAGTVGRIIEQYDKSKHLPYQEDRDVSEGFYNWYFSAPANATIAKWVAALPSWFRTRFGSLALWQWIGLVILVCLSVSLMVLTYRLGRTRSQQMRQKSLLKYWTAILFAVVAIAVPLLFMHVVYEYLTLRGTALYITNFFGNLIFLLAVVVLILSVSTRIADSIIALPSIQAHGLDATLTRIVCRLLGIVVATIVFLEGGRYLGFPITTLLASAGIGGLAIALSAQGMIKGLFGTITLLLDKPFKVGERVVVNGHDGFVEEIGLRSTKIRTLLNNHLVSIPNDQMSDSEVENIGRRQHLRRSMDLRIPIDSTREKVEKAVSLVREALEDHEGMDPALPPRVHLNEFEIDSFTIRAIYWYHPPEYWKFIEFSEKLNLQIMRGFEEHGIQFSLPSRISFWKEDDQKGPLDIRIASEDDASDGGA